jgi:hypothetical protein
VKDRAVRILLLSAVFSLVLPVSGCGIIQEPTVFVTTTQVTTEPNPVTVREIVTRTVMSQIPAQTITATSYITTTTTVPMVTSAPPPPPSTVYLTTTVVQEGLAVRKLRLPSEEMLAVDVFNICLDVQNVSARAMECNVPVIITDLNDEDYELVLHVEFFIESGETKKVCTDDIKLPLGSYYAQAGEIVREFYMIEGGG